MATKAPVAPAPARPAARAPKAATPAPAAAAPAPRRAPTRAPAAAPAPVAEPAAPKVRLSASDEEIAAAVAGDLQPREVAGELNQESLTARAANDRPVGRPLGVTTGLPIMLAACYVFQQNEKAAPKDKLTDDQIAEWLKSEFPGRDSQVHNNIQYCRRLYNAGRFTKNQIPKTLSNRFDENGQVNNPVRGAKKDAAPPAPAAQSPTLRRAPAPAAPAPARAPQRASKAPVTAVQPKAPARRPVAAAK